MRAVELRSLGIIVAVLIVSLSVACTANKQPSRVETALANMAKDVAIPLEAETLKNPLPSTPQVINQGQQVYAQSCALCHGPDGRGHTDLGRNMYPPAMDLNSPHVQHWKDAELFWIVQNGVRMTGMPSWKSSLPDNDIWSLVEFVRNLPGTNAAAANAQAGQESGRGAESQADLVAYGRTLYRQEGCFTCHVLNHEGVKVGPDLTVEGTRGRTDDWLVGHFRDPGKYSPGSVMPAFVNLNEVQLRALTAFLQSQKGAT